MGALRGGSRKAPGAGSPVQLFIHSEARRGAWGGNRPKLMGVTILIKKFYFAQEAPCLNFHRGHVTAIPWFEGVLLSHCPCHQQGWRTGALRRVIGWQHWQEESVTSWAL
jgi:hypothetical protein